MELRSDMNAVRSYVALLVANPLKIVAELFAGDAEHAFDSYAMLGRDGLARLPLAYANLCNADGLGEFSLRVTMFLSGSFQAHEGEYQPCCYVCQEPGSWKITGGLINIQL